MKGNRMYVICVHIDDITMPRYGFHSEEKAVERLIKLRENALTGINYSLQYVYIEDGED